MMRVDEKQQELIDSFFKEWTTWCPEHIGYHLIAVICIGLSALVQCMPYQIWNVLEDFPALLSMYALELAGITNYRKKFILYKEGSREKKIDEVLKYLPVSYTQFCIFKIRKAVKLYLWLTGAIMVCQTFFAIAFLHTFSIGNILLPFIADFIIPLACMLGDLIYEDMGCRNYG